MDGFYELEPERYPALRRFAEESAGEKEYYLSLLEGRQRGRVFGDDPRDPGAVLFWHYAGYGYVAGKPDAGFLGQVLEMVRQTHPCFTGDTWLQGRFILQQDDPGGLAEAAGVAQSARLCFTLDGPVRTTPSLPEGFTLQPVDAALLPLLRGEVTPAFSWHSGEAFLRGGQAVCVLKGREPAAWAFSGAVGGGRMDIGVETAADYRGRGLASAAASALAERALAQGFKPVWGCDQSNRASAATAARIGFRMALRHGKFKRDMSSADGAAPRKI